METLVQDIRYGFRMLVKNPGFSLVAILTLAVGIGANTAIFSVINALMIKMLPVDDPRSLVIVGDPGRPHGQSVGTPQVDILSYPLYRELRDQNQVFSTLAAGGDARARVSIEENGKQGGPETANGRLVTGNYFSTLGIHSVLGRVLTPDDDKTQGGHPVAVLSYGYWQRRFASDPSVIGRSFRISGYPFTIVGVVEPAFTGEVIGDRLDFWVPLMMQPQVMPGRNFLNRYDVSWMQVMGRLKSGVSLTQAQASMNVLLQQLANGEFGSHFQPEDRGELKKSKLNVVPGARGYSGARNQAGSALLLLLGMVGLILLIACVNVANLLLARASARRKEVAVRLAIGARPAHLLRQLLTESILLAFAAGVLGLTLSIWATDALVRLINRSIRFDISATPDVMVLAFTGVICLLTGIAFGLVPALRSLRVELAPTLKDTTGSILPSGSTPGRNWGPGKLLVAAQVALSLLVLFGAGVLVRSLRNLKNLDLGYTREHVLMARIDGVAAGYKEERAGAMFGELQRRFATIPGVTAVTFSENGLFTGTDSGTSVRVPGFNPKSDDDRQNAYDVVGPGYFSALHVPILSGRGIGEQDTAASLPVTVVNESFAKFYFGAQNPVGRSIVLDSDEHRGHTLQIVGVARDVRDHSVRDEVGRRFYFPWDQAVEKPGIAVFEIRTVGDPNAITTDLRHQVESLDANIPILLTRTLDELVDRSLVQENAMATMSSIFGGLALLLACIGLYGIISYTVAGRTREIGVRMALGAQRTDVLALVLREAAVLVVVGALVGIPVAIVAGRLIHSMLFGLSAIDPISIGIALGSLAVVAGFASYLPARRASKVDPMVALRYE